MSSFTRALGKFATLHGGDVTHMRSEPPDRRAVIAHRLKGVAAQLGLAAVAQQAAALERSVKAETDASEALDALQIALEEAIAAIAVRLQAQSPPSLQKSEELPPPQDADPGAVLLQCLATDDVDQIEAALEKAAALLPGPLVAALRRTIANYDFRGAEDLLRQSLIDTPINRL